MGPAAWIFGLIAVILGFEIAAGRHNKTHRPQDICILVAGIIGSVLLRPVLAVVTATVIGLLIPAYKGALAGTSFWVGLAGLFLVAEFFQYWIHRFAHDPVRHKFLFWMHRTHHTAPYVNVTLMYRTNLVWPFVHSYTWVAAAALYLGLVGEAAVFYLVIMAWNALTHSDFRWDDWLSRRFAWGPPFIAAFECVFVTPRIHHTHHGYGVDGRTYRNYCTFLSIYDRLFNTLYIPAGRPQYYGVPEGEHHWVRQMVYPLLPLGPAQPPVRRLSRTGQEA